jgi:hypothetical protein
MDGGGVNTSAVPAGMVLLPAQGSVADAWTRLEAAVAERGLMVGLDRRAARGAGGIARQASAGGGARRRRCGVERADYKPVSGVMARRAS